MNLHDKIGMFAELHGNQGGTSKAKISPQHLSALLKELEEVEL
jgi:hypothetical protein